VRTPHRQVALAAKLSLSMIRFAAKSPSRWWSAQLKR
jgi:hypothetical protein